ncbi:MAG: OmpA family protein [Acidobacteria bacterium]|nr:OmpA family protein [Acidobacteriota bacterium]
MSAAAKGKKDEPEKKPRRRIKKVAGHGGHHGGSWKVAYADFVTAMMALFLVLWLLSQADTKLKESVANYFRNPGVFASQAGGILAGPKKVSQDPSAEATSEQNMFNEAASKLKKELSTRPEFKGDKDRIKVEITDEGLRIQIIDKADRVTFESGSAVLDQSARQVLAEIAKAICELPNPIAIGGHTDKNLFPQGSTYTNWELSADRANAARRLLENTCVKPDQIRRVVGYADTELLYPNQPLSPANRRINITVLRMHQPSTIKEGKKIEGDEGKSASVKEEEKTEVTSEKEEKGGAKHPKPAPEESSDEDNRTEKKAATEKSSATQKSGGKSAEEAPTKAKHSAH